MKQTQYLPLILILFSIFAWECEKSDPSIRDFFKWTPDRAPLISAHRGGPYPGYPENCIETFENVLKYTDAIIECDIAMTKDSILIMMHDNTLDRTTTGSGKVTEQYWEDIQQLYLKDFNGTVTEFHIPTLEDVLYWAKGKCILSLDVKKGVPFYNVIRNVEFTHTQNDVVIITYNLDQAKEVYNLNSGLMISAGIYTPEDIDRYKKSEVDLRNLMAFTGTSLKDPKLYELLHDEGIFCILGTLGNLDKSAEVRGDHIYLDFINNGIDILATDRPIEVARAIRP